MLPRKAKKVTLRPCLDVKAETTKWLRLVSTTVALGVLVRRVARELIELKKTPASHDLIIWIYKSTKKTYYHCLSKELR